MGFDKPKVTIDLEEYQELKDKVNGMNRDEYVLAAKKVIAALLTYNLDVTKTNDKLYRQGIIFNVTSNSATSEVYGIDPDQICISLIDKINKQ